MVNPLVSEAKRHQMSMKIHPHWSLSPLIAICAGAVAILAFSMEAAIPAQNITIHAIIRMWAVRTRMVIRIHVAIRRLVAPTPS